MSSVVYRYFPIICDIGGSVWLTFWTWAMSPRSSQVTSQNILSWSTITTLHCCLLMFTVRPVPHSSHLLIFVSRRREVESRPSFSVDWPEPVSEYRLRPLYQLDRSLGCPLLWSTPQTNIWSATTRRVIMCVTAPAQCHTVEYFARTWTFSIVYCSGLLNSSELICTD